MAVAVPGAYPASLQREAVFSTNPPNGLSSRSADRCTSVGAQEREESRTRSLAAVDVDGKKTSG
jgi:hypothetical protein